MRLGMRLGPDQPADSTLLAWPTGWRNDQELLIFPTVHFIQDWWGFRLLASLPRHIEHMPRADRFHEACCPIIGGVQPPTLMRLAVT